MKIDTGALFGNSMSWKEISGVSQRGISGDTGIDASTLSRIKAGKEGFGPEAAKKFAPKTNESAMNIYISSQVRSARMRREAGEIDDATVMRIVGKVIGGLQNFPGEMAGEEETKDLQDLAAEASKGGTATKGAGEEQGQMSRLGRAASGVKKSKRYDPRQDDEAGDTKNISGDMGRRGRNADGTSRKKLV